VTSKKKRSELDGSGEPPASPSELQPAPERAEVLERLLDLAYDVSSYLRHRAQPTIRLSAAVLLAASLAACGASGSPAPPVQPLTQEVRRGLPSQPGDYPVVQESVLRDQQGIYHFQWRRPGETSGGQQAAVSLLKLGQADSATLVIPQSGDPLLNLPPNTPIQLATTSNNQQRNPGYVYWMPFMGGGYFGPRYYDPPAQTVPSSGTVSGSTSSVAPPPASARTSGVSHGVSGQAGGAGFGSAATNKTGAAGAGALGGQSAAGSSSFSSGKSGSSAGSSSSGGGSSASSSS